jgi:quercetin dioxygenase-like cupin family protein
MQAVVVQKVAIQKIAMQKVVIRKALLKAVLLASFSGVALAQSVQPKPILPEALKWQSSPAVPGAESTWLVGAADKAGLYVQRVRLAKGAMIRPHTHPDERASVVLKGTLYVGFGETVDEAKVVAVPVGAMYIAPAGVPHYAWAKDEAVEYQESGVGPTGSTFMGQ